MDGNGGGHGGGSESQGANNFGAAGHHHGGRSGENGTDQITGSRDAERGEQIHRREDAAQHRTESREEEHLAGGASGVAVASGHLGEHGHGLGSEIDGREIQHERQ